ncbi:MAG: tyrosine-type recombinase/integrase [Pseudomonas sp.]|uniref:tyrosine-type recombinase/integrase n=1 Tax=Pseudomonas sp. TaxID=306 RepID=UPI003D6F3D8E
MLTDFKVRQAKATGKNYMLSYSDDLSLFVSQGGSKLWHFRYSWLGERARISLGSYPELLLKDARELRDQARTMVVKHINPRIERKQKLNAIKMAGENTFIAVYEKWLDHRGLTPEEGRQTSLSIIPRVFKKDVFPLLKRLTIYEVTRPMLREVMAVSKNAERCPSPKNCAPG